MGLQDKVVLITGATGGLGSAVVRAYATTGARLALTARSQDALEKLAREVDLPADGTLLFAADLAIAEAARALVAAIAARWGGVDVLLNIAGGWQGGARLAEVTDDEFHQTMHSNLLSAFHISRAVLPHMAERGWGRIISIASRAAVSPAAKQVAYNIAKAGIVALTASIAADYARQGVVANVILPSIIDNPTDRSKMPTADYSRWVKPEEVAAALIYLSSDEAAALNGASIPMYGRM